MRRRKAGLLCHHVPQVALTPIEESSVVREPLLDRDDGEQGAHRACRAEGRIERDRAVEHLPCARDVELRAHEEQALLEVLVRLGNRRWGLSERREARALARALRGRAARQCASLPRDDRSDGDDREDHGGDEARPSRPRRLLRGAVDRGDDLARGRESVVGALRETARHDAIERGWNAGHRRGEGGGILAVQRQRIVSGRIPFAAHGDVHGRGLHEQRVLRGPRERGGIQGEGVDWKRRAPLESRVSRRRGAEPRGTRHLHRLGSGLLVEHERRRRDPFPDL